MGWTAAPTEWAGIDAHSEAILNEFTAACNERYTAFMPEAPWEGVAAATVGDDYHPYYPDDMNTPNFWGRIQYAVRDLGESGFWVQSHDLDGTPRDAEYYHGAAVIEKWTWENICKAAGLWRQNPTTLDRYFGFRRVVGVSQPDDWTDITDPAFGWSDHVHVIPGFPDPEVIHTATPPQPGDDAHGQWLWHDAQVLLNLMVWTGTIYSSQGQWGGKELPVPTNPAGGGLYLGTAIGSGTFAAIQAAAAANWNGPLAAGDPPSWWECISEGHRDGAAYFRAYYRHHTALAELQSFPNHCKSATEFYLWATPTGVGVETVFDANGDMNIAGQDVWSLANTTANADGGGDPAYLPVFRSPLLSDPSVIPASCAEPPGDGDDRYRGYDIENAFALTRWNVAGGFEYQ